MSRMPINDETRQAMRDAVAEGIRDVLSDEESVAAFWTGAFDHLQALAQRQTGRMLLGSLSAIVRRILLFIALGLIVYAIGGWSAIEKLWHALNSAH